MEAKPAQRALTWLTDPKALQITTEQGPDRTTGTALLTLRVDVAVGQGAVTVAGATVLPAEQYLDLRLRQLVFLGVHSPIAARAPWFLDAMLELQKALPSFWTAKAHKILQDIIQEYRVVLEELFPRTAFPQGVLAYLREMDALIAPVQGRETAVWLMHDRRARVDSEELAKLRKFHADTMKVLDETEACLAGAKADLQKRIPAEHELELREAMLELAKSEGFVLVDGLDWGQIAKIVKAGLLERLRAIRIERDQCSERLDDLEKLVQAATKNNDRTQFEWAEKLVAILAPGLVEHVEIDARVPPENVADAVRGEIDRRTENERKLRETLQRAESVLENLLGEPINMAHLDGVDPRQAMLLTNLIRKAIQDQALIAEACRPDDRKELRDEIVFLRGELDRVKATLAEKQEEFARRMSRSGKNNKRKGERVADLRKRCECLEAFVDGIMGSRGASARLAMRNVKDAYSNGASCQGTIREAVRDAERSKAAEKLSEAADIVSRQADHSIVQSRFKNVLRGLIPDDQQWSEIVVRMSQPEVGDDRKFGTVLRQEIIDGTTRSNQIAAALTVVGPAEGAEGLKKDVQGLRERVDELLQELSMYRYLQLDAIVERLGIQKRENESDEDFAYRIRSAISRLTNGKELINLRAMESRLSELITEKPGAPLARTAIVEHVERLVGQAKKAPDREQYILLSDFVQRVFAASKLDRVEGEDVRTFLERLRDCVEANIRRSREGRIVRAEEGIALVDKLRAVQSDLDDAQSCLNGLQVFKLAGALKLAQEHGETDADYWKRLGIRLHWAATEFARTADEPHISAVDTVVEILSKATGVVRLDLWTLIQEARNPACGRDAEQIGRDLRLRVTAQEADSRIKVEKEAAAAAARANAAKELISVLVAGHFDTESLIQNVLQAENQEQAAKTLGDTVRKMVIEQETQHLVERVRDHGERIETLKQRVEQIDALELPEIQRLLDLTTDDEETGVQFFSRLGLAIRNRIKSTETAKHYLAEVDAIGLETIAKRLRVIRQTSETGLEYSARLGKAILNRVEDVEKFSQELANEIGIASKIARRLNAAVAMLSGATGDSPEQVKAWITEAVDRGEVRFAVELGEATRLRILREYKQSLECGQATVRERPQGNAGERIGGGAVEHFDADLTRVVVCDACWGHGRIMDQADEQFGKPCSRCRGSGRMREVIEELGKPKRVEPYDPELPRNPTPDSACEVCHGSGRIDGGIAHDVETGQPEVFSVRCSTCGGTGIQIEQGHSPLAGVTNIEVECGSCDGKGSVEPEQQSECRACNGSGRVTGLCQAPGATELKPMTIGCPTCKGTGKFPTMAELQDPDFGKLYCPECAGTGLAGFQFPKGEPGGPVKCPNCGGQGKIDPSTLSYEFLPARGKVVSVPFDRIGPVWDEGSLREAGRRVGRKIAEWQEQAALAAIAADPSATTEQEKRVLSNFRSKLDQIKAFAEQGGPIQEIAQEMIETVELLQAQRKPGADDTLAEKVWRFCVYLGLPLKKTIEDTLAKPPIRAENLFPMFEQYYKSMLQVRSGVAALRDGVNKYPEPVRAEARRLTEIADRALNFTTH